VICPAHGELPGTEYPLPGAGDSLHCPLADCDLVLLPLGLDVGRGGDGWDTSDPGHALGDRRMNGAPLRIRSLSLSPNVASGYTQLRRQSLPMPEGGEAIVLTGYETGPQAEAMRRLG
jgi:hypothetical protein